MGEQENRPATWDIAINFGSGKRGAYLNSPFTLFSMPKNHAHKKHGFLFFRNRLM
jgi:hypothetical protein